MHTQSAYSDKIFELRSYGVAELGQLYNPSLRPDSASKALRCWIDKNQALTQALHNTGWQKGQRKFTPLQTKQIVRYLGEP